MSKFLDEFFDNDDDHNTTYFSMPSTLGERIGEYKNTCLDVITMLKMSKQNLDNYIVPETAIIDRMGQKPKGRCVQMRVYSLSKRHFAIVFITFISLFVLTTLFSLAGPPIITSNTVNSTRVLQTGPLNSLSKGPFSLSSPVLSAFNQQIWLLTTFHVLKDSSTSVSQVFQIQVTVFPIDEDGSGGSGVSNHTHQRTLVCGDSSWCDPIVVMHLGYLLYSKFRVKVTFIGLENFSNKIEDVKFDFKTYNSAFTQFEIWFRFAFLILTFIVTCAFAHVLRYYHVRNWTIEQKWMSILLPLLLLYNDPLFPLSFIITSWVPGMLDAVFQASFLCLLLLFWLCVYHGIRSNTERRPFCSFYLPKLIVCGLLWLAAVTLSSWQQYNELHDPTYQYELDLKNFLGMKIFFFVIGGVYLLYLGFLFVRACTELHSKPYANIRLKFLTAITACVIIISVTIVALRFGSSVLQDNFVSKLSTKYKNAAEFVCFYALINYYIYTMAFVYSPSKQLSEEPIFRADTGFTMLNNSSDEEEDVIFGNDSEDTPLRNGYHTPIP